MEDNRKKFGMEMVESLHCKVKSEASARGLKLYQATDQAFRAWLGSPRSREYPYPSEHREAHETLEKLISSGANPEVHLAVALSQMRSARRKHG